SNDPTISPISFEINPNPNSGAFTIAMQSRQNTMATVQIIDLMGKINYSTAVQLVNGKQSIPVHASRLTNGIYFVRIFLSDGSTMVKRVEIVND
ncbi:MAG TPA: T9SS type A sorting domain-containing protein, partial [Saprospiraceae bacterium]|nr:T9SS type A sorting domain-containing protein [Saprospiraceae bacterium]